MASKQVCFRASAEEAALLSALDASDSAALHWLVGQARVLLWAELDALDFSGAEWNALADAGNGLFSIPDDDALMPRHLWAEVADACRLSGLDRRWGIDGDALVARLRALTPMQDLAVAAAVKTFWRSAQDDAALARSWCGRVFAPADPRANGRA